MTQPTDLFGHPTGPAQGSLFGDGPDRLQAPAQSFLPDPERVRRRCHALLEKARGARTSPWSERDLRMWRTVFPNMTTWLRDEEEADQLRLAFQHELDRLSHAEAT